MDVTLNLLPPRLIREREGRRRRQSWVVMAAAAVVPFVIAYAALHARVRVLQVQTAALDRQVGALTPVAQKARKLGADRADLKRREDALGPVTDRLPRWSPVLVQLSTLLPADAWFTSLTITNGQFAVVGQSLSESAVSTLTMRLAASPLLTGTSLKYVREAPLGTRSIYSFEIDGAVRGAGRTP